MSVLVPFPEESIMVPNPFFPFLVWMGWTNAYFANLAKLFSPPPDFSQVEEDRVDD